MEHLEKNAAEGSPPAAGVTPPSSPVRSEGGGFRPLVWLGVALVVGVGVAMILPRDHKAKGVSGNGVASGGVVNADLTLITSDRGDVACLSEKTVERYACEFSTEATNRKFPERDTLRPYMTRDRRVYLIPGLFLEPHLEKRYQSEPPQRSRDQLRRFTATCKLKPVGRLEGFKLRWAANGKWSEPQDADVATVIGCQVDG